jgi:1-acyl-sn-glycerol-3-phosphate acyltransferase
MTAIDLREFPQPTCPRRLRMQNIIVAKPYRFVPPYHGERWARLFKYYVPHYLNRKWGIATAEFRGVEHLKNSMAAGHGIILAPSHSRPCDPMVLGLLAIQVNTPFFTMASWHLFMEGWYQRWLTRRLGAFSVNREGMDREALRTCNHVLVDALRPLVIFPEGVVSRTNDRLGPLQEGVAFIARTAAKQRAKKTPPGQIVIHPVFQRYFFEGDLSTSVVRVLEEIEKRFSWRAQEELPLLERVLKVGQGLLCLKEIEYFGKARAGPLAERLKNLTERLLVPLEKEWQCGQVIDSVVERVKRLRSAMVPEMATGKLTQAEKARRWRHLADCYLAQQLACYPPHYLEGRPSKERLLETVERYEEDLTDVARIHRPLRVLISVGPPIEVSPERERNRQEDPLMQKLQDGLEELLCSSKTCAEPVVVS